MKRNIVAAVIALGLLTAFVAVSFFPPLVSEAAAKKADDNNVRDNNT